MASFRQRSWRQAKWLHLGKIPSITYSLAETKDGDTLMTGQLAVNSLAKEKVGFCHASFDRGRHIQIQRSGLYRLHLFVDRSKPSNDAKYCLENNRMPFMRFHGMADRRDVPANIRNDAHCCYIAKKQTNSGSVRLSFRNLPCVFSGPSEASTLHTRLCDLCRETQEHAKGLDVPNALEIGWCARNPQAKRERGHSRRLERMQDEANDTPHERNYWVLLLTSREHKPQEQAHKAFWRRIASGCWPRCLLCSRDEKHKSQPTAHVPPLYPFRNRTNPLASASLLSIVSTQWLQPLITLGARRVLEQRDVWPVCQVDSCDALQARVVQANIGKNYKSIGMVLFYTFQRELLLVLASLTSYIAAMSLQPLLSRAILNCLANKGNVFHLHNGYTLVVLLTIVSLVGVTCLNYGLFMLSRIGVNMRSLVMDWIYKKALRLSPGARHVGLSMQSAPMSTGEIVTLLGVDCERVFNGVLSSPWLLVAPLAFIVTVVLLALCFDPVAALCGALFLVIVLWISHRLATRIGELQRDLLQVVEERAKATSESLQGIRVMKLYAWEDALATRVQEIRVQEIALYRKFHSLQILNTTLLFLTPVLLGGMVLGVRLMLRGNKDLSVTDVFTLIAIVNISRLAVNMFPSSISAFSQLRISIQRIDTYLASEELSPVVGHGHRDNDDSCMKPDGSITVHNAQFDWSSLQPLTTTTDMATPCVAVISDPSNDQSIGRSAIKNATNSSSFSGFCLDGINLQVDPDSLVMIVGAVGAGKTSLLHALLGEMTITNGIVEVNGQIAYVSQDAWIRNASVKDNILFEAAFDTQRYRLTEIGEHGINLSGGQKARVAIARAMYRTKYDILMMDDPLSAVDPHVAQAIFNQCIVGLAKDKTRLLVLNSHYDLLVHADKIVVVQDGRIVGDGNYDDIVTQFPDFRADGESSQGGDVPRTKIAKTNSISETPQWEWSQPGAEAIPAEPRTSATLAKQQHSNRNAASTSGESHAKLVQDEDRVKGRVRVQTYAAYFSETGFNGVAVIAVLFASYGVSQVLCVLVDWWQGHWTNNMDRDGVDPTYSSLCLLMIESCIRSSKNIHDGLFRRVLSAPVNRYFDVTPVGRILNRFSNDLDQLDANLPQQCQNLFQSVVVLLGCLGVCAMASFWVGLSYIPMLMVFVIMGLYFKKTSREVKRLESITRTPIYNLFNETLHGLSTIRAFQMQDTFAARHKANVDSNTSLYLTYRSAGTWLAARLDWLSVVTIFVVGFYLVAAKGQLDSVVAGITMTYSLMLTSVVQWVVRAFDIADNSMTSVERLLHFRNIPVEDDGENAAPVDSELWPSQGAIKFNQLCMRYRPELPLVLRGVNMNIQGGEKIGICGRTGAGKSSLMAALFRTCELESGTVLIDDMDIQSVKLRDLRRSLAIIPQDPVLFSGSLRLNLDPFGDYADAAIWFVLKQVHLFDSVTKWGTGLDFVVSEQGGNLSVGQRQLLCIARALLKDSKIVVLDEATANVDTATDSLIEVAIKEAFVNKTVLIIAHRINTIMHCDKIAVMNAGRVAEFGAPDDLLCERESMFASLATRVTLSLSTSQL
ncbi:Multidrug resistance-associated protein abc superfamily, partial [Globisporangium splendens]